MLLCMSVNPGWGGQSFIASSPAKVERLCAMRRTRAPTIEVDGGIDADTAGATAAAGAASSSPAPPSSALRTRPVPYPEIATAAGAT